MGNANTVRPPAVAGQFYPGNRERLASELERFVGGGAPAGTGVVRALIVPHAGYQFSGAAAGKAYALVKDSTRFRRVVVLAPSHRVPFRGLSVGGYEAFSTPLGNIPVDSGTCRRLTEASRRITDRSDPHTAEHALEVQLPFLQHVLGEFHLVPILCGDLTAADVRELAPVLREELFDDQTLLVVSSDFTHYGRSFGYLPFTERIPERLKELDMGAVQKIEAVDPEGFLSYIDRTDATICGGMPIALLLGALRPDRERLLARLIEYTTSGHITGDFQHSVSYVSVAFFETGNECGQESEFQLSAAERDRLLHLARETISRNLRGDGPADPDPESLSPTLRVPGAAFVTLHVNGRLRGCIGNLQAKEPLYRNVIHNATSAAFHDPRFTPLTSAEYDGLSIEISVLTPAREIASLEAFEVGRHGIILEKHGRRAVFLPQVASEQGWDRETTARHLALKAGLPASAWRRNARFFVFEAIVFGEEN